ncbi:MAG TPA: DUF721 domain-containing protein [Spirochaetota bacterium]|nr:DUF721 domain-containing protein [Spirochaetota bacterium]HPJ33251.1 DUF721 domain-containing protein [Spirochaetota bacterium]
MKFRFGDKRKKNTVSFSNLVSDIIDDLDLNESFFMERLRERWPEYVGNILSTHSFPDRIFSNILFIRVDHSVYANELSMHQGFILKKVKEDFGSGYINAIRFEVKKSRWNRNK